MNSVEFVARLHHISACAPAPFRAKSAAGARHSRIFRIAAVCKIAKRLLVMSRKWCFDGQDSSITVSRRGQGLQGAQTWKWSSIWSSASYLTAGPGQLRALCNHAKCKCQYRTMCTGKVSFHFISIESRKQYKTEHQIPCEAVQLVVVAFLLQSQHYEVSSCPIVSTLKPWDCGIEG